MTKYHYVIEILRLNYHPDVCDGQDLWHHENEKVLHMEGHSFKNAETEMEQEWQKLPFVKQLCASLH